MFKVLHKLTSPYYFYRLTDSVLPWLTLLCLMVFSYGLISGLIWAPADYKQGDGFRIMYIHVPAAMLSLSIYVTMALCAAIHLIWKIKLADIIAHCSAPIGASFTLLALISGAIWGKPMWGTWWVWDARLTSELILLFLYLAYIGLYTAIEDRTTAATACHWLLIIGVLDIPIIHFSVNWWFTLHQGASLSLLSKPTIAPSMLYPLLAMIAAFGLFYIMVLFLRARTEILQREIKTSWAREVLARVTD